MKSANWLICLAILALFSVPVSATIVNFSGTVTWTQIADSTTVGDTAAGNFAFVFGTGPDLRITRIDFELGNGDTSTNQNRTLFWDLTSAAPGFRAYGSYGTSGTSGSIATIDPIADGTDFASRAGAVTFTSFVVGDTFLLIGDVDRLPQGNTCNNDSNNGNCAIPPSAEFIAGGAFTFRIYLASTNPNLFINGTDNFVFGPSGWVGGTFGGQPGASFAWSGQVDLITPEPSTMFLVGGALVLVGAWGRKRRVR